MNNGFYQPAEHFIPVSGAEGKLVEDYYQMMQRVGNQPDDGMIQPIVCPQTEEDRQLYRAYHALASSYQQRFGLSYPPALMPVITQPVWQPPKPHFIEYHRKREFTDMELAQIMLSRVQLRRRNGCIYQFGGQRYKKLDEKQLKVLLMSTLREELEVDGSSKQLSTVLAAIMAEPTIEVTDDKLPANGLCLEDCTLDIQTLLSYAHHPNLFFTIQLKTVWNPNAVCPICDQFFNYAAGGDPVLIQRFWEILGYCLVPQDGHGKCFVLLQGDGDSGKSVYGAQIESFYDQSAVGSVDIFKLGDRFSLSQLVDKAVNISMDLSEAAMNAQSMGILKQITGGDLVQVEAKYQSAYAARITCTMVYGTNHRLRTANYDRAFMNRVRLLPFRYSVPKHQQDKFLIEKLKTERPGIFQRAIRAYRQLVANNYVFAGEERYDISSGMQTGEEQVDQDSTLELFFNQCVVVDPAGFVVSETLHTAYMVFCEQQHAAAITNSQVFSMRFGKFCTKCGVSTMNKKMRVNGEAVNCRLGVRLR